MLSNIFLVSLALSTASATAISARQAAGSVALGGSCTDSSQCGAGVQCFASNSMRQLTCGSFNAACALDSQCFGTTCNKGLCNGFLATSSTPSATTTPSAGGALPAPSTSISAAPSSVPLGGACSNTAQCAGGAECFASNIMRPLSCGAFNAGCKSDSQCFGTTCNNGLCNGFLASSSSATAATTTTTPAASGALPAPSESVSAAPGSVALGGRCSNSAQCGPGVQCFASNSMRLLTCGSFNAACTADNQCFGTTCNNGLCNGFLASSSSSSAAAPAPATTSAAATASTNGTAPTSSRVVYPGAAATYAAANGIAVMGAAVAFALAM